LNADKARRVFADVVARPLGLSLEAAAYGAHLIAVSNMIRGIKQVSTERGRDPREFALFAFGGNGPLFACGMASVLGIKRVIVPPSAGLFSSFGLLYADVEHHYARTFRRMLRQADPGEIETAWAALATQAWQQLRAEGFHDATARVHRYAALQYHGQSYELRIVAPEGAVNRAMLDQLEEGFGKEHEKTYGHRAGKDEAVELTSLQVVGHGLRDELPTNRQPARERAESPGTRSRRAYFGTAHGWLETPITHRSKLTANPRVGPLIVDEYDATCVIPPGATAHVDAGGNIVVDLPTAR
jgi:N-methylhydantoinase A